MSMISKQQFDELVKNSTRYLTEHGQQIAKLQRQNAELKSADPDGSSIEFLMEQWQTYWYTPGR